MSVGRGLITDPRVPGLVLGASLRYPGWRGSPKPGHMRRAHGCQIEKHYDKLENFIKCNSESVFLSLQFNTVTLTCSLCGPWPPLSLLSSSLDLVTVFALGPNCQPSAAPYSLFLFQRFRGNKSQTLEQKFSGLLRSGKLELQISYKAKFSDRKL